MEKIRRIRLPSLWSEPHHPAGKLPPWRLGQVLETATMHGTKDPHPATGKPLVDYGTFLANNYIFVASSTVRVERSFYSAIEKTPFPEFSVNVYLGHVGRSSFKRVAELVDISSGCVCATRAVQVVTVNKTTRKPVPMSDFMKNNIKNRIVDKGCEKLIVNYVKPPHNNACYVFTMRVRWSDIDSNGHTNFASYDRYCYDALMEAVSSGSFSWLSSPNKKSLLPVKQTAVSFKGETFPGQELTIKCWQNDHDPFIIHIDISHGERAILQNTLHFYRLKALV